MSNILKSDLLKLKEYLANRPLITDLISKLVITLGVVLIIGGLYLVLFDANGSNQLSQQAASIINWIPGIPFYVGQLTGAGASTIGLVSWIVGVDLFFVGLGLWARHKFARFAAIFFFGLSAFFQFVQFLYFGALGSPTSIVEVCINGVFAYFLFSRFEHLVPGEAIKKP